MSEKKPDKLVSDSEGEEANQKIEEQANEKQFEGEPEPEITEEEMKTLGTNLQERVISNYPTSTNDEKLNVPYIEKQNGNICVKKD